mmetsp:Transcript_6877/g.20338  ORF Transcript_6877/g.20338 Transcript_6877/m.20338 type:complete len:132 (-) Transcript_6877:283-678(-)
MQEAELKHGRTAMLATLGWVAVDLGVRLPNAEMAGLSSLQAHDAMVKSGYMFRVFLLCALIETISFGPTLEMLLGNNDRKPGDFGFDPAGLGTKDMAKFQVNEIKNGRLAMLAFSGICTQAALTGKGFPYF